MAILKIRDKNGVVHEIVALKGENGSGSVSDASEVPYDGSTQYTGGSNVKEALDNINATIANFSYHEHNAHDIGYAYSSVESVCDVGSALDYLFEKAGDVANYANALKGSAAGEAVVINDASPLPHNINVKVKRKNLFNKWNMILGTTSVVARTVILEDGTIYVPSNSMSSSKTLRELAPELEVGKTYVISGKTTGESAYIWLNTAAMVWQFGKNQNATMTEDMLNSNVYFYTFGGDRKEESAIVTDLQIEEGTTATAYAPYIDVLDTVKVVANGKNLVEENAFFDAANWNCGVYNPSSQHQGFYYLNLKENTTYTISWDCLTPLSGIFQMYKYPKGTTPTYSDSGGCVVYLHLDGTFRKTFTFTTESGMDYGLFASGIYYEGDTRIIDLQKTLTNCFEYFQIEIGNTATEYESYKELVYVQGEDVKPMYPVTTISTDTYGALVNVEYNKDTNKVIETLVQAIISLGGNV